MRIWPIPGYVGRIDEHLFNPRRAMSNRLEHLQTQSFTALGIALRSSLIVSMLKIFGIEIGNIGLPEQVLLVSTFRVLEQSKERFTFTEVCPNRFSRVSDLKAVTATLSKDLIGTRADFPIVKSSGLTTEFYIVPLVSVSCCGKGSHHRSALIVS